MRTEVKTMQAHPSDEQYYIDLMQEFCWTLKSSQEIKLKTPTLETRGGYLYSVTESEHYVKLIFERPFEFENRQQIVQLENEYFGLSYPAKDTFKAATWTTIIIAIILGIAVNGIVAFLVLVAGGFWIYSINQSNAKKQQQWNGNNMRRQEILAEVRKVAVF
jgi:hypothetical protein